MTQEDQDKFSKLLANEEARVRKELDDVAIKDPATNGFQPKPADYGGETDEDDTSRKETDSENTIVIEEELERHLTAILKAQEKLKTGHYGVCEKCGADIPAERLEVLPATPYCINCAQ